MSSSARKLQLLLFLTIEIGILLICFIYIANIYKDNIYPDKVTVRKFSAATCKIINKQLEVHQGFLKKYRARFEMSYTYKGKNYTNVTYGNGLSNTYSTDWTNQEILLSRFNLGQTYPCWINPTNPKVSVLVLRHNWESVFLLFIPFIAFLLVTYFMSKTLFKLIASLSRRQN